jgi:hypothetical protein
MKRQDELNKLLDNLCAKHISKIKRIFLIALILFSCLTSFVNADEITDTLGAPDKIEERDEGTYFVWYSDRAKNNKMKYLFATTEKFMKISENEAQAFTNKEHIFYFKPKRKGLNNFVFEYYAILEGGHSVVYSDDPTLALLNFLGELKRLQSLQDE